MNFIVAFLIVSLLKSSVVFVKNPLEDVCPPHNFVTSQNVTVEWSLMENSKSSEGVMKSDPMCLDENKLPVHRHCSKDGLRPPDPPDCAYTQTLLENMSPCPALFQQVRYNTEDDFLCVLVSSAKEWSSDCLQYGARDSVLHLDSKDLRAVKNYLETIPGEKFWLPLRSSGQYLPFTWYLPGGDNFGSVFDEDKFKSWRIEGERLPEGNCLALSRDNDFRRMYIEDCGKHYPTICIYNEKKPHLQLACPENYFTARYRGEQKQCLSFHSVFQLLLFEGCEQFFLPDTKDKIVFYREVRKEFRALLSDSMTCEANFYAYYPEFSNWNSEMWLMIKDRIDNVFWSPNMHSYDTTIFNHFGLMTLDSKGYWHIDPEAQCSTCVKTIEMFTPELSVVFHRKQETLELIIYSGEFLWRADADDSGVTCYTDADSALLSNVKIKDLVWSDKIKATDIIGLNNNFNREYITKSIYELKIGEDTPGKYWCEGLTLPDYKVIRSAPIIAYDDDDGTAFAFRTIMECKKCESGFTNKELERLAKDFKKLLEKYDHRDRIEEVKTMRIEELPEDATKLEVIFHVFVEDDDVSKDKCPKNISREICTLHELHSDLERIAGRASSKCKQFHNITVKHTEFCLPYHAKETDEIQWMSATIGERSVLQRLCLTTNLLPVYRFCTGNFIVGAKWDHDHIPVCREEEIPEITQKLFDLDNSEKAPIEIIDSMQEITYVDSSDIIPADLYLMGSLTRRIATANDSDVGFDEIEKIITIFSHTMEVKETTAKASQILNSTNTLLDMNERIMNGILVDASVSNKTIPGQETNHLMGVIEVKAKNIISYVIDPTVANVSGIALYRSEETADDLSDDFTVEFLYANQSTNALIDGRGDLEVATFVPQDLLNRINEINQTTAANATQQAKPPLRIVITVIANDRMFQENRNVSYYRANGRIVTVTIPGYGPNLPTFLPIVFHTANEIGNVSQACGFWDFSPKDRQVYSEWSTTGCEFISMSSGTDPPIVLCGCSHITNFAFLLTGVFKHDLPPEELIIQQIHLFALDVITVLGCSLSLAGVVGIWITAIFFKTWREKASSKVLLQLSVAIALQMLLFLFINAEYLVRGVNKAEMRIICITLGALLQYSVLVVFSWMLITAYLQYLRYVVVFGNPRPPHFTLKSIIVGWILPTLPVILVIGLDMDSYLPPDFITDGHLHETNCYPHGTSLYFGVLLPVGMIFTANFATYIAVIYSITRKMDKSTKKNDTKMQMAQLRLSVLLFFLLGMSWIFGFLVYTQEGGSIIFSYLFCTTATLQGFVLFSYFVVMDPTTRKLWEQFFTSLRCGKSEKFT